MILVTFSVFRFLSLIVSILVVDSVVKVLVILLLILQVYFTHPNMEPDLHRLVNNELPILVRYWLPFLLIVLRVKRAQDDRVRRIIAHEFIFN